MASSELARQDRPHLVSLSPEATSADPPYSTYIEVGERVYRISFWPDADWDRLPNVGRPEAIRDVSDRGWFGLETV